MAIRSSSPYWTLSSEPCDKIAVHFKSATEAIDIPTGAEVRAMVEAAFWATLQRDECRDPRFELLFAQPDRCRAAIRFPGRPLSADAIAKLAPALATGVSRLGVHRRNDGALELWGLVSDVMTHPRFRGIEPGRVIVQLDYENLAIFHRDGFDFLVSNGHGLGRPQCADLFARCFGSNQTPARRVAMGVLLLMVVEAMRAQGNGGTVLVVLSGENAATEDLDCPNRMNADMLSKMLDRYTKEIQKKCPKADDVFSVGRYIPEFEEYLLGLGRQQASDLIRVTDTIGALTGVDGAVVLTEGLDLLSFGVVIRSPADSSYQTKTIPRRSIVDFLHEPEQKSEDVEISRIGGTRRQSAARFVAHNKGALAITASHDGPLTIALWVESLNSAVLLKDVELMLD